MAAIRRRGWRRVVRITARVLVALIMLLALAIGALLIAVHTDWGREQIRRRAVVALDELFTGGVSIGRIEGSVLGHLTIHDVTIEDAAGEPAIAIDVLEIEYALWPLAHHEVEIDRLAIDGLRLRARRDADGTVSLSNLLTPQEPSAWSVDLRDLMIRDAAIELVQRDERGDDQMVHLDDVEISGALRTWASGAIAATTAVQGTWREMGVDLTATSEVSAGDGVVEVPSAELSLGGLLLSVRQARYAGGDRITGALALRAPAEALRAVWPDSPLRVDVALDLAVQSGPTPGTLAVGLVGTAAGQPLRAELLLEPMARRGQGELHAQGLDLAQLIESSATTALDIDATLRADEHGGETRVEVRGPGGARAVLDAALTWNRDGDVELTSAHLVAHADDLGRAGAGATARGAIDIDLEAQGRLARGGDVGGTATSLAAHGRIDGRDLVYGTAAAQRLALALELDGVGLPGRPQGHAHLDAERLRSGELWLAQLTVDATSRPDGAFAVTVDSKPRTGPWLIQAAATIRIGPVTTVALGRHRVRTRGITWAGGGGVIELHRDRVVARGLRTGIASGSIAVDGSYHLAGRRSGDFEASLHTGDLDLAVLDRSLRRAPVLAGSLEASLHVERRSGDYRGSLTGRAAGILLRAGATPIDANLDVRLDQGAIALASVIRAGNVGAVDATLRMRGPRRVDDLAAWRRLDRSAIEEGRIGIVGLDLAAAVQLAGIAVPMTGHVDGTIELTSTSGHGSLRARGITAMEVQHPFDADLTIRNDGTTLAGTTIELEVRKLLAGPLQCPVAAKITATLGSDDVRATLAVRDRRGQALLAADTTLRLALTGPIGDWQARLAAAPIEATITTDHTPLRALLRLVGRDDVDAGTLDATLTIAGTVAKPTGRGELTLAGLRVDGAALERLHVEGSFDGNAIEAKVDGSQAGGGSLAIELTGARDDLAATRAVIDAAHFDLAALASLAPRRFLGFAGLAEAHLRIRGADPATMRILGTIDLRNAQLPIGASIGTLRDATVALKLRGGKLRLTAEGRIGTGHVELTAAATLAGLFPEHGTFSARASDLRLINELQPRVGGRVSGEIRREGDHWRAIATVSEASVAVPAQQGEKLHEVGMPADMVIIENGQPPPSVAVPEGPTIELGVRPAHPLLIAEIKLRRVTVQADEVRARIRGDLTITVGADALAIDGSINADRGSISVFDRHYRLERASARFDGSIDPFIDVALLYEFPDLTMYVALRGRASKPELALSSRPGNVSQSQLLSYLLGGSPGAEPGSESRDAAAGVASSLLSRKISGYLDGYLPIDVDVLRYEAATASSSAAVKVGKWLTRKLFLAYRRRIEARPDQNAGEAEVEYWLNRRILLDATVGDRGYHGVDLLWLKRW